MRPYAARTRRLTGLVALALIAAGCSSPSADVTGSSPKPNSHTGAPSGTPTLGGSKAPGKGTSPFASLAGYLASRPGVVTAAVYDRRTGRMWVLHPGVAEYTASIVKVEIMGTALKQAQDAGSPLPGTELGLVQTMIENSSNTAATELLSDVGGAAAVQRFDDAAGMTDTAVSKLPFIPGSTSLPGWGLTTTTASDEVRLVARFAYPNTLLNHIVRMYGLHLMEHVESDQAWGVSVGVHGANVALKNGWLPLDLASNTDWQVDSIGWIHGNGRDYVLAVLSNHNPSESVGIATIDRVAAKIYAEL